jgi:hypothetical protein
VPERLGWRVLALWTVAFCAHRAVVLWFGFDGTYYWEETYRLLMGEALADRWPWPLLDVQADPYAGGSLVFAALAAPMVRLIGPSLLGLKIVALVWSALGFVAWTSLVDRWFGRWPAFVLAFLFVCAPPVFVVYNLVAMGSHAEVVTLAGVQLLLAYRFLYGETRGSRAWLFAWALVAGLGTWFTYEAVLPFTVCVALALVAGLLPPRLWPVLAVGFVLGFSPWIVANVVGGAESLDVLARTFGMRPAATGSGPTYAAMLQYLLRTGIPLALRFPTLAFAFGGEWHVRPLFLAHAYFALYVLAVLAVGIGCVLRAGVRPRALAARPDMPLLAMFPVFVLVLAASDHVFLPSERVPFFPFRLLVPFLPAVMAVMAIAVGRMPPAPRLVALVVLGCFGGAGIVPALSAGADARPRLTAEARATGAEAAGHLLYYKHPRHLGVIAERIAAMPVELRGAAFRGVGFSLAYHHPGDEPVTGLTTALASIPIAYRAEALAGARLALDTGLPQVPPRPASARTSELRAALDDVDPGAARSPR